MTNTQTNTNIITHLLTWLTCLVVCFLAFGNYTAEAQGVPVPPNDSASNKKNTNLRFPFPAKESLKERDGSRRYFDFNRPSNFTEQITYDEETNTYVIQEMLGDRPFGMPTYLTPEEYAQYQKDQDRNRYFKDKIETFSLLNQKPELPELSREGLFDRLFGGTNLELKPQGNLDLLFGYAWQHMDNPQTIERNRKRGYFDFDMNMNVNVVAQIGDKLKLNISNSSMPSLGQQNTEKIEYSGSQDQVLKKIELGNVSFPLNSSLLSGPLSLQGIKTELQFGKLYITALASIQKSQRRTITLQGGAQSQEYEIKIDDYDENRNFLLGQYFYEQYEPAVKDFPLIRSQIQITEVEVWITNKTGTTEGVRDIIAFMDLGEHQPYNTNYHNTSGLQIPSNKTNNLYQNLQQNPALRKQSSANNAALGLGLESRVDFQRSTMRKLRSTEFSFHPQLGYILLNTQVNPDDVLAVAFRYTYNGETYQVGEFAEDFPPTGSDPQILFLKMLKAGTSGQPHLPTWNWMMKNVYTIGYGGGFSEDHFRLEVFYQDPKGGEKRYLAEGSNSGTSFIELLNLDRLNSQLDPHPDGVFDYVDGITVNQQYGKIIFPTLKPFSDGILHALDGNPQLEDKYTFPILYDSTKSVAQQFSHKNRYIIKGSYRSQSSGGADIRLGGFQIPEGSVSVIAGGQRLQEGLDYQVNYSSGTIQFLNQGVLNSGMPITISYEDNAAFGMRQQSFLGTRLEYFANNRLTLGATYMQKSERPHTNKVQYGDIPVSNKVFGFDINYETEAPFITKMLNKLPFYSTNAPSLFSWNAEVAGILPGHHKAINTIDPEGTIYIDDFEGASTSIDLRFPANNWSLASVPLGARNQLGQELFPEAKQTGLSAGRNRARLAWYMLEPDMLEGNNRPNHLRNDTERMSYWRKVYTTDLFPQRSVQSFQPNMPTLDLAFYPTKRGPYNFDTNVEPDGSLENPKRRWGGIQKAIQNTGSDFESANIEYISFWVMDPFIYDPQSTGGDLYINLGSVSEDVLKDGKLFFENGLPYPADPDKIEETDFGIVPKFQQQITRSFDNDPEARALQDVGYNGLDDAQEREKYNLFLESLQAVLTPDAYQELYNDPASDNFMHFRDSRYDEEEKTVLQRYKNFNNPQGNSPVSNTGDRYSMSGTTLPDSEDINRDNTLNETEAYFQYRIRFEPDMPVGANHIVDKKIVNAKMPDGTYQDETWYLFKVPTADYDHVVGGISDFRSIGFIRMFMSDFEEPAILRFAQLQFDRSAWRKYNFSLKNPGENIPEDEQELTNFSITSVSLEENYHKEPVPYRSPPGIEREQMLSNMTGQALEMDEQSMSFQICGLQDGDARAAFKEHRVDLRKYKNLRLFVHAESVPGQMPVRDGDVYAFVRIGSDMIHNYYEYKIPLKVSPDGTTNRGEIWPDVNEMDLEIQSLVNLKMNRNAQNFPSFTPYSELDDRGNQLVVVGNPNLADIKNILIGVENPERSPQNPNDDGQEKCVEVWFNELRLAGVDESPGYAMATSASIQLADLGNVHVGAQMHTAGYGHIDQQPDQRFQDDFWAFDASTNLNLGRLLPEKLGIELPVYAAYTQMVSNPEYNPYDKDITLKDSYELLQSPREQDSLRRLTQNFQSIKSISLNNVKFRGNPNKQRAQAMPWSLRNFDFNYSYNKAYKRNFDMETDALEDQRLGIGYIYNIGWKPIEPFKKLKWKSPWAVPIKDFNLKLWPSSISFRNDLHRIFGETQFRNIDGDDYEMPRNYLQNFIWDRQYNVRWELTKALSVNYNGMNQSRIDEPYGPWDTPEKRSEVWDNFKDFGRNTYYSQDISASYTLPLRKIQALNWTNITASYASNYHWTAASRLMETQGNVIANNRTRQISADFNFTQLYQKNRHLRAANQNKPAARNIPQPSRRDGGSDSLQSLGSNARQGAQQAARSQTVPPKPVKKEITIDDVKGQDTLDSKEIKQAFRQLKRKERRDYRDKVRTWRLRKSRILPEQSDGTRAAIQLATMLKRINISYSDNSGTTLPGFMDESVLFGSHYRGSNWYDFVFGGQPDARWLQHQADLNRMSRDSIFNGQMQQRFMQNITGQATIEPLKDIRVELNWKLNFSKNHSQTFKVNQQTDQFEHFSPYSFGTYDISYIGVRTLFTKVSSNKPSQLYQDFLAHRQIISQRLGENNPYVNGAPDPNDPDYAKGYTKYSQEVLIPAFLAAYTGRSPRDISLMSNEHSNIRSNPFRGFLPMPNWNVNYNGLGKLPALRDHVNNIQLQHRYTGNLSMNGFVSSFYYQDLFGVGFPSFIDSNSHNFIPFFQVPNITISENFGPFIGIDANFKNGFNFGFRFAKSRILSLSLVDFQVSETNSTEFTVSIGHRVKGLRLPFTLFGANQLENDLNFKFDFGLRSDFTANSYLAQNIVLPTRGQRVITIMPTADYIINDQLQIQFYFDYRQTIPVLSTSYPITTARGGIKLTFIFAGQ